MRIILTRSASQAGGLEEGLREAGFELAHLPLTRQVLPQETTEITAALSALGSGAFSWILLTSGNTVRFLRQAGWDSTVPPQTHIGVVGPGTARVLAEVTGLRPTWMPQDHSAAGILAELPAPAAGQRLLLPQSARAEPTLAHRLRQQGWEVTRVSVYDTVDLAHPDTSLLRAGDVVLITSSSAAEVWARLQPPEVTVLAIGEPTADTLSRRGHPATAVLPEPTAAGVLAALRGD
ncbi:uroporphyrinogen-III synthase [Nesterenkonia alba]|uniref:uroporphyrinogen-III synthase n=1 Tax=Nesterenkonia alba TaxID=515814 RepID=UPI0003B53213|nr:uroporphyrinogen-III synthase [Nesterenkonia alba]